MVVILAGAGVVGRGGPEARTDRPVDVEAPLADVAIPARLQLAHEDDLPALDKDGDAPEVAAVGPALDDGLRRRGTEPDSGNDVHAVGLETGFRVLPVAVGGTAAGPDPVLEVFDVQDGHVRLVEHLLAAVAHAA